MTKNVKIIPGNGLACPRCGKPTQIREHAAITSRELSKPYYHRRWFMCLNSACPTTTIMTEDTKVFPAAKVSIPKATYEPQTHGVVRTRLIADFMREYKNGMWG